MTLTIPRGVTDTDLNPAIKRRPAEAYRHQAK